MVIRFGVWSGILWIVFSVCVAPVKPKTWTFSEFVLVCGHCVFWRCHGGIFGKCQHGDKPTQAAEHNGIHWHGVYGNHCENLLQVRITSKNNMILETAIKIPKIRFYILRVISKRYAIGGFPGINLKPPKAGRTLWGRRCKRWNVEETWHDIEVAASFWNFIPEIWFSELRNLMQWTLHDSMLRSQLPVDSSCKIVLRYVTLDIFTFSGFDGWVKLRRHFAGLV